MSPFPFPFLGCIFKLWRREIKSVMSFLFIKKRVQDCLPIIKGEKEVSDYFFVIMNEKEIYISLSWIFIHIARWKMTWMIHGDCMSTISKYPIICHYRKCALRLLQEGFKAYHLIFSIMEMFGILFCRSGFPNSCVLGSLCSYFHHSDFFLTMIGFLNLHTLCWISYFRFAYSIASFSWTLLCQWV